MPRSYDVCGVGHALVDIQHSVPASFLAQFGIDKGVMTLVDEERQETLLRALRDSPMSRASGGSAANTMITVARLGGRTYYACQLGHDEWGDFYQRDLEQAGVRSNPAHRTAGKTGQCLVFVTPDADRTLNTCLGVSSSLGEGQIDEGIIAESAYVYLEGYLLSSDSGFSACRRAQSLARRHRTSVSLTLSDPAMVELCRPRFETLLAAGVNLVFCNEEEARALTGADDREAACRALQQEMASGCVTCGADGAMVYTREDCCQIPGLQVDAVDTTGAGDSFAGGVLFGLTHGLNLAQAAKLGNRAAAEVVAQYGPRLERDLRPEIHDIVAGSH